MKNFWRKLVISFLIPIILLTVGFILMNLTVLPLSTLIGATMALFGVLLLVFVIIMWLFWIVVGEETKELIHEQVDNTVNNQFSISFLAGIFGGLSVTAATYIIEAEEWYVKLLLMGVFLIIFSFSYFVGLYSLPLSMKKRKK